MSNKKFKRVAIAFDNVACSFVVNFWLLPGIYKEKYNL